MTKMIHFDTLHYVDTLKDAGISDKQARAFAKSQQDAFSECLDTTLASKADLGMLKADLKEVESKLSSEFSGLKTDLQTVEHKIESVKLELKSDIKVLQSEMVFLKRTLGILVTGMGTLVFKAFF